MNLQRKEFGDAGDAVFGLTQTANPDTASLASDLLVVPGQMAYMHIPATELRNFVDGLAPGLAKNQIADCASGYGHRYMAGHDLLLDVPATFSSHGASAGVKHAGHIILTDFPTKAGIPIPGFSHSGLGQLLEQAGIAKGWLQISLFDTGVGVFAFADGATNLIQALQGSLLLDFGTACQTFGMGSVEIGFAVATQNPMLLAGGVQNVLAGLVSTWQTITVYVDPLDFLGAGATSTLLGFAVAHGLAGESLTDASLTAVRSGAIGALFTVSSAFGFGALAGFVACQLGRTLAQSHNRAASERLTVDRHSYELLIKELVAGNPLVGELILRAMPNWGVPENHALLNANAPTIQAFVDILSSDTMILKTDLRVLSDAPRELSSIGLRIENDPDELLVIYRRAGLR